MRLITHPYKSDLLTITAEELQRIAKGEELHVSALIVRLQPEPKPDITKSFLLENHCFAGFRFTEEYESSRLPRQQWIRVVFDGETAQIKSVEVLHE